MSAVGAAAGSPMELFRMKHAAETALVASTVPATIVRATAFLELWIDLLRRTAGRSNRPMVFGRGQNPVNFVSVRDVAALLQHAVTDQGTRGRTLEIGGPDNLTFTDLACMVAADRGGSAGPRHVPRAALHVMAATLGRVRLELGRQARAALVMDSDDMTFDGDAVRAEFADLPCTSAAELLPAACCTPRGERKLPLTACEALTFALLGPYRAIHPKENRIEIAEGPLCGTVLDTSRR